METDITPAIAMGTVATSITGLGQPALLCDRAGNVLTANEQSRSLLGQRTTTGTLFHTLLAAGNELEAAWPQVWQHTGAWSFDVRLRAPSEVEPEPLVRVVAIPATTAEGQGAWLLLIQDLGTTALHVRQLEIYAQELSQLYQANRDYTRQLEEAAESRERFYSVVSHELKTPMTSMKAALEIVSTLEPDKTNATQIRRLVNNIQRSTLRLERLLNDLLDVAVARRGGLFLEFARLDIVDMIDGVVGEMAALVEQKELSLKQSPAHRSKAVLEVRGDRVRLQQVVQNLLSNAVKACPRGGSIGIAAKKQGHYAQVDVTTYGVTIDPEIQAHLFEPFTKSASQGYQAGAGLGLSVVDALVKEHGGSIVCLPGQGQVVFRFTIPLWQEP